MVNSAPALYAGTEITQKTVGPQNAERYRKLRRLASVGSICRPYRRSQSVLTG